MMAGQRYIGEQWSFLFSKYWFLPHGFSREVQKISFHCNIVFWCFLAM
uniref:Uncharacterized protein MANES_05G028000 n=1 Tax=Rhizophora mucronata TaxID=61149 RepID=A0A2P2LPI3_RHIMU